MFNTSNGNMVTIVGKTCFRHIAFDLLECQMGLLYFFVFVFIRNTSKQSEFKCI